MIGREKAAELHKQYGPLDYPIDVEDIANKEGLTIIIWPFIAPVEEVKVGRSIGIKEGLSIEWRRWDIAHALGHHLLHHGNQLVFRMQLDGDRRVRQVSSLVIFLCPRRSFRN